MMLSLSDKSDAEAAPSTVFSFSTDPSFPAPAPVPAPAPAPAAAPVVKGALDVTAVLSEAETSAAPAVEEDGGGGMSQQQLMKQLLGKKGKSASKSVASGARKLTVSSTEVKLESFEGE